MTGKKGNPEPISFQYNPAIVKDHLFFAAIKGKIGMFLRYLE
jgi:hypothetical protein